MSAEGGQSRRTHKPLSSSFGGNQTQKMLSPDLDLSPTRLSSPLMFFKQRLTQKQTKKGLAVGHVLEASKMPPPDLAEI